MRPSWPLLLRRHRVDHRKADAFLARNLMSAPPVTVGPEASVVEAARLMERHDVKWLPVVDADGSLAGIVSRADLLGLLRRSDADLRAEVREQVLRRPLLLPPNTARDEFDLRGGRRPRRSPALRIRPRTRSLLLSGSW
ncbi:CBS domain-containing protein [Cryptosporangium arvum]|uniref:CBS domain-containing protein n=1 Tax=Cryptosporangium arvum TaxID=80871 RepID=UPI00146FCBBB|nr:CBS domain-containing protein [Cryptosporangium arvum]